MTKRDKILNNKQHVANEEVIMSIDQNVSLINQSGEKRLITMIVTEGTN